jgi:signal transduction histidine kinase
MADKEQIKQVMINLVQNAAESIEHSGAVQLRARQGVARRAKDSIPVVTLEVSDTGKGIPPEMESRLFDPFFSTKDGGTGLGLPIAARIIEKHGGYIQYQTQQNRGTTFSIVLPRPTDDASTDSTHRR